MIDNSTEATTLLEDSQKLPQIRAILQQHGYPADERFIALLMSRVSRVPSTGGLAGVDEAVALLRKAYPNPISPAEKPTSYIPKNHPVSRDFAPVSEQDRTTAKYYFGPGSNSAAANNLAQQRPQTYAKIKSLARKLGLVA